MPPATPPYPCYSMPCILVIHPCYLPAIILQALSPGPSPTAEGGGEEGVIPGPQHWQTISGAKGFLVMSQRVTHSLPGFDCFLCRMCTFCQGHRRGLSSEGQRFTVKEKTILKRDLGLQMTENISISFLCCRHSDKVDGGKTKRGFPGSGMNTVHLVNCSPPTFGDFPSLNPAYVNDSPLL